MKIFHSSIFRALCAIVVGVLILKYPQDGVTWLTMAVGELFLISGIVALIAYWYARQHSGDYVITDQKGRIISGGQPTFPIVGAGSVLLGLVLVIAPGKFVDGLMYVLGGIMILGGSVCDTPVGKGVVRILDMPDTHPADRFVRHSASYGDGNAFIADTGLVFVALRCNGIDQLTADLAHPQDGGKDSTAETKLRQRDRCRRDIFRNQY